MERTHWCSGHYGDEPGARTDARAPTSAYLRLRMSADTRILIGYNEMAGSRDALALGRLLAGAAGADLAVATVIDNTAIPGDPGTRADVLELRSGPVLERARQDLAGSQLEASFRAVGGGAPGPGLIALAMSEGADLIVIGSTHRGPIGRLAFGTTADSLIRSAACAFAVAPRGYAEEPDPDLRLIGLAYDGSLEAKRAARVALGLAEATSTGIRIFGVREPLTSTLAPMVAIPATTNVHGRLEAEIDALIDSLPADVAGQKVMLQGDPASALLDQGRLAASAMVFGCQGFGRVLRLIVGSVTSQVVRAAPWPVVVVPEGGGLPFATEAEREVGTGETAHGAGMS